MGPFRTVFILFSLFLLCGCSTPRLDEQIAEIRSLVQGPPTPPPPVTLTFLVPADPPYERWLSAEIDRFETFEPSIKIELRTSERYEADLRQTLAQDPPDIFLVDSLLFPELYADGALAEPPEIMTVPGTIDSRLLNAFRIDGRQFCIPHEFRTLALIYDRMGFAREGLTPPSDWDQLVAASERLTDLNRGSFGTILSPDLSRWMPLLLQAGANLTGADGSPTIDSPQALHALQTFIQLFRDNFAGYPAESNSGWAGEVLGKGYGSMVFEGNWIIPYLEDEFPDFEYGVAPLPAGPAGAATLAFTSCYVIASSSSYLDEAMTFLGFLQTPAVASRAPIVPERIPAQDAQQEIWANTFPELTPFLEGLDSAQVWQMPPGYGLVLRGFNRRMLSLFRATIESEDLLREIQQVAESVTNR